MAPWIGIEPTTNGLTGKPSRGQPYRIVRNQGLRIHHDRENPVQYTPVQLAGKQMGNILARAKSWAAARRECPRGTVVIFVRIPRRREHASPAMTERQLSRRTGAAPGARLYLHRDW